VRCCPRSTTFVQYVCVLCGLGFITMALFGRSLASVVQSTLGLLMSAEAYVAAGARRD
jgi:Na+/H+ antiporter NhaA